MQMHLGISQQATLLGKRCLANAVHCICQNLNVHLSFNSYITHFY